MKSQIVVNNGFQDLIDEMNRRVDIAAEKCGLIAEGYAQEYLTAQDAVDTGNLRNSITHHVLPIYSATVVNIGTPVHYGPYVELGTGKYAQGGGGSPPWVYPVPQPDGSVKFYRTEGMKPRPYLKPAIADHEREYLDIIEAELQK